MYGCRACNFDACRQCVCSEEHAPIGLAVLMPSDQSPLDSKYVADVNDMEPVQLQFFKRLQLATEEHQEGMHRRRRPGHCLPSCLSPCLSLLGLNTGPANDISVLTLMMHRDWTEYDTNRNKRLSKKEVTALISKMYERVGLKVPPTLLNILWAAHDHDHDQHLSYDEYRPFYIRLIQRVVRSVRVVNRQHLRSAKKDFDTKYELGKFLNKGAQGKAYLATNKLTKETVVVKRPNDVTDTSDYDQLVKKSHPNIVRVFELFTTPAETFIVMECCSGGDLFKGVSYCYENYGTITLHFIAGVLRQVVTGVAYLHSTFKECHNDIKPENILLDRKPRGKSDVPRCMVADFGCASPDGGAVDGDPRYDAPEACPFWAPDGHVTYKSDVYALGVMFFELLSGGLLPYTDAANISGWSEWVSYDGGALFTKLVRSMEDPNAQPDWGQIQAAGADGVGLCQGMMYRDPRARLTMAAVSEHRFFEISDTADTDLPDWLAEAIGRRATLSDLKVALLNLVASRLQGEALSVYQKVWDQFCRITLSGKRGTLSETDFAQVLARLGLSGTQASDLYLLADVDRSGCIDFNEFVAVMLDASNVDAVELGHYLRYIFHELAGDTGRINHKQLSELFVDKMSGEVVQRFFSEMDQNGDGLVSYEEFSAFLSTM